jgi:outer membrane protein TolC
MATARWRELWWKEACCASCVFFCTVGSAPGWAQAPSVEKRATAKPDPTSPNQQNVPAPSAPAPPTATLPSPTPLPQAAPPFDPAEVFTPGTEVMPIDLPTALQIANAGNPTIALARARVDEAVAAVKRAEVLWLPNLQFNPQYLRHDGEIQNSTGVIFSTNKSSLGIMGGAIVDVDTGNALFAPLIARRLLAAQTADTQAVDNNIQLAVALAYIELVRTYAALAVNTDLLARDVEILRRTENATKNELTVSGAEVNRARNQYQQRVAERIGMKGDIRVASSHLARLLLLSPTVALVPAEHVVVPIALVPENAPADELVGVGLLARPELAESRALVDASRLRLRQSQFKPLLPHLQVYDYAGTFGGGQDATMNMFNSRNDAGAGAVWQLDNFGLGNVAANRMAGAEMRQANFHVLEIQAQVGDEVVTALQIVRARREMLDSAQAAVDQARIEYDKFFALSIELRGEQKLLDTLRPVIALQELAQARFQYLAAVVEYNRAQFQLHTAMGRPSMDALPKATAQPVQVPVVPAPYQVPK